MTIRAMNWAWGIDLPPAMKLVLLKLADRANDDGECWPGMDAVAQACGVSKSSMIRYLARMEADGILRVEHRKGENGRQQTNVYVLNLDFNPGVNLTPGTDEPGVKTDVNRVSVVTPEKELKLFLETKENPHAPSSESNDGSSILPEPVVFLGNRWEIDDAVFDSWIKAFAKGRSSRDTEDWIEAELVKAALWLQANPKRKKKNWLSFLTGWLDRSANPRPARTRINYHAGQARIH